MKTKEPLTILKKHEISFIIKCLDMVLDSYNHLPSKSLPKEQYQSYRTITHIKEKLAKLLFETKDNDA